MNMNKFEFIKQEIFVSKEHYLAFRQGWKDFINSGKAKPVFTDHSYGRTRVSALNATHHLLFNILIENDLSKTFRPSDIECKRGFEDAYYHLMTLGQKALDITLFEKGEYQTPSYLSNDKCKALMDKDREKVERFLEPFGKVVTIEMLSKLHLEYLKVHTLTNKPVELKKAA